MAQVAEYSNIPPEVRSWFELHRWQAYTYHRPTGARLIFAAAGDDQNYPLEIQVGIFQGKRLPPDFRFCEVGIHEPQDRREGELLRLDHRYLVIATIYNFGLSLADRIESEENHSWLQINSQPEKFHWGNTRTRILQVDPIGTKWVEESLGSTPAIAAVRAAIR